MTGPPSYASIFGELAAKKVTSDGVVDYTKEAAGVMNKQASGVCGKILCGIFCSIVGIALPIAEIVIGALYLKECSAQYLIPIYLIVSGVFGLISGGSSGGQRMSKTDDDEEESKAKKCAGCCGNFVGVFVFAWFICGCVWIYSMTECSTTENLMSNSTTVDCFTKDPAFEDSEFYCRKLLYDFAYWEMIAKFVLYGLMLFIVMCGCMCCCIAFCCAGKAAKAAGKNMAMKGMNDLQSIELSG